MPVSTLPTGPSIALVCLLIGFLCQVARHYRRDPALLLVEMGTFAAGVGIPLVVMRPTIPDFIAIPFGNGALMFALALFWQAVAQLNGKQFSRCGLAAPVLIWLALCALPQFRHSLGMRVEIAMVMAITLVVLALWQLIRLPRETRSHQMLIIVSGLHVLSCVARGLLVALPSLARWVPLMLATIPFEMLTYVVLWPGLMLTLVAERAVLEARAAALRDDMTGLLNRRGFWQMAEHVPQRGMLLFDIDHFKRINDTFGHATGDSVIRHFGTVATAVMDREAVFGRIGGEEFAAAVSGLSADELGALAERVRAAFERTPLSDELLATVSIGYAPATVSDRSLGEQMALADAALYCAKQRGRNRVEGGTPNRGHDSGDLAIWAGPTRLPLSGPKMIDITMG
ncbi:GGDEF domain-containing protein [Gluconacetobacter liquefaciens]|uniref:diguanylate cyclase n=1 Tax=Gluconacetobacter liquefaciens TaxID=89584 RepID=A0A370G708_GLULI|nr:GGDEF domain-containing protein [Gluconacetobacter liquefaciens]MBB2185778.1 GGDEF domain-containing protein [Gluconacetobacter liquefaciens]RDI39587.1 diguanylate cyclase (GGDEF)-like protein [Gluconacetobacter liquefaciens]GBR05474.1 diguanylate cyclase [Gluconacetobacter liquefaciens NRIC 0522]GEB36225.1 GGDEF domain-containing protein [Gluconacetobacter liquefaciens]